jgi:hypothetical protein
LLHAWSDSSKISRTLGMLSTRSFIVQAQPTNATLTFSASCVFLGIGIVCFGFSVHADNRNAHQPMWLSRPAGRPAGP